MKKVIITKVEDILIGDVYLVDCCGSNMRVFKQEFYRVVENLGDRLLVAKVKLNSSKNGVLKTRCKPVFHMNTIGRSGTTVWRG